MSHSPLLPATDADLPAIEDFLSARAESSMFLRSNLREHGLGDTESPRAMDVALTREAGDAITGVFGLTNGGYATFQAPQADPETWQAVARWIGARRFLGLTGAVAQATLARKALGMTDDLLAVGRNEPLYRLDLSRLKDDGLADGSLRAPVPADLALLEAWYTASEIEALGASPERAAALARSRAARAILEQNARILERDGTPLAMTAFNAHLPDMVQVGGVYTPPDHRNAGAARTAVARHLAEARETGVRQAILFAASPAASRAYEAIGFERIGDFAIALLKTPRGPLDA
ncbi:GNAT family N-acetyltransferase [Rhodobacter sp. NTK016B]|uniref:GNAT family N-acetyltransferase n=1 Tax=Rhodobacter sp. NTK016B TaxID=2759676 RepID=UPI001A8DC93E|nr:GNAT family N-acetyltransferase [Rhodobacter sp. NTK016B]MBN8294280.1 GNAT family N-acetyltransferase [Rhodobacter sp. NTK016B]